uniref:E3 SUMO-protein ligase ZBED1-like n=1 Tax=Styela clava TaxID=7725 RepID=UPI0019393D27|nr:E3 SUMO-protein ligase ZBED1-like [Styela clava]
MRRGRRKSSEVWSFFTSPSAPDHENKKTVICCLCKEKLSFHGTTTNLSAHLKAKHPSHLTSSGYAQATSSTVGPSAQSAAKTKTTQRMISDYSRPLMNQHRAAKITSLITNVITGDMRPINLVQGRNFVKLINFLEPGYTVPSRQSFTRNIEDNYCILKVKVKNELAAADNISLTADLWSSCRMDCYFGVTAHFLVNDTIQSRVVATKQVTESHTAENIALWVDLLLADYEIPPERIVSVVTDNGANIVAAMRLCSASYNWQHIRCVAHTLQLCVHDCLKNDPIKRAIGAARRLVQHVKQSTKAMSEIRQLHQSTRTENEPQNFDLIIDCQTRWDSTHDMLERLCSHQWKIRQYLSSLPRTRAAILELRDGHWIVIQKLIGLLEPLKTSTKYLQGEKYISISSVYPVVKGLCGKYSEIDAADDIFEKNFKLSMHTSLQTRFAEVLNFNTETPNLFHKSTLMDPHHKGKYFTHQNKVMVRNAIIEDMGEARAARPIVECQQSDIASTSTSALSNLDTILAYGKPRDSDSPHSSEDEQGGCTLEMEWYNKQKCPETDTITWWNANKANAPLLYKCVKKYMITPATSAPAERSFSSAGLTSAGLRSRLTGEHVEHLNFLHCNMDKM